MIELAKILPENEGGMYMNAAIKLIRNIADAFGNWDENTDYVIGTGSCRYPIPGTFTEAQAGVHISIIYADYYFAEALLKLLGSEFNPW
jgi:unsaturated chondroitin disaccharide hydrolase